MGKESLPFDEVRSLVWRKHLNHVGNSPSSFCEKIGASEFCVYMIAGILIGLTAFVMGFIEDHLVKLNAQIMMAIIDGSGAKS